jgi:hypothetical protein
MRAKITADHLERTALVYVRQSTPGQVRDHTESRRRQYGLVEVARELGFHRVETIDDDLGISGSGFAERPGFQRLLTIVCAGTAGAVLALEASRLARNDRDWSQLVELGAVTKTVLIDHDGIYDPRLVNDRLLLGLKGIMSDFEMATLRQRALEPSAPRPSAASCGCICPSACCMGRPAPSSSIRTRACSRRFASCCKNSTNSAAPAKCCCGSAASTSPSP